MTNPTPSVKDTVNAMTQSTASGPIAQYGSHTRGSAAPISTEAVQGKSNVADIAASESHN